MIVIDASNECFSFLSCFFNKKSADKRRFLKLRKQMLLTQQGQHGLWNLVSLRQH